MPLLQNFKDMVYNWPILVIMLSLAVAECEGENDPDDLKSEISLVHEIGIKRGVKVDFKVRTNQT
jgi:hypothetical protein